MSDKKNKLFEGMSTKSQQRDDLILKEGEYIHVVDIDKINPNPYQPRKEFAQEALQELSDNIKEYGLLQPILVAKTTLSGDDSKAEYTLIAGERRLRASKLAGHKEIKVILKKQSSLEYASNALFENIMREDLGDLEKFYAISNIKKMQSYTNRELSVLLNIKYSTLSRIMCIERLDNKTMELYKDTQSKISLVIIERLVAVEKGLSEEYLKEIIKKDMPVRAAIKFINKMEKSTNDKTKESSNREAFKFENTPTKLSFSLNRKEISEELVRKIEEKLAEIEELLE